MKLKKWKKEHLYQRKKNNKNKKASLRRFFYKSIPNPPIPIPFYFKNSRNLSTVVSVYSQNSKKTIKKVLKKALFYGFISYNDSRLLFIR